MKRTQIQLDEGLYGLLKQKAYEQDESMAQIVREALAEYLGDSEEQKKEDEPFTFIGSGRTEQGEDRPVSEHHDESFSESIE